MAKARSGGGLTSNKLVNVGVRTGAQSKGSSPASASQLGQSTAFTKEQVNAGRGYDGAKLGNEVALNSKSAPGQGRQIHACGSQGQWGPTNPGESRGESRGLDSRGRGKDTV
jgi:hypothetical protein